MSKTKFVEITDRKGTSIVEVIEDKATMTRNIVRFICDVQKQETKSQTQEVTNLLIEKLNK